MTWSEIYYSYAPTALSFFVYGNRPGSEQKLNREPSQLGVSASFDFFSPLARSAKSSPPLAADRLVRHGLPTSVLFIFYYFLCFFSSSSLLLFNKVENFPKRLIEANVEEKECGPVIDKWLMNKSVIRAAC